MKRRITPEQLLELKDEQQQKLREWWKPQEGDWAFCILDKCVHETVINPGDEGKNQIFEFNDTYLCQKDKALPLLDISQMIELLKSKSTQIRVGCEGELIVSDSNGKYVNEHFTYILNDDLCNELWEIVKEVL